MTVSTLREMFVHDFEDIYYGESDAGDLLPENLEEEKSALDKLAGLTDEFEYDTVVEPVASD